jgi:hypothetical protein
VRAFAAGNSQRQSLRARRFAIMASIGACAKSLLLSVGTEEIGLAAIAAVLFVSAVERTGQAHNASRSLCRFEV